MVIGVIAWSQLQCEVGHDVCINKVHALGVRAGELSIALTDRCGRRGDSRIEIRDARAINTGGVFELERLCISELVFEAGMWHPVAQMLRERNVFAVRIATTHVAVLIA